MNVIKFSDVEGEIFTIRDNLVILDSDVAELYGVETRDINKSVKNNPDKFPDGYILKLSYEEKEKVVENFHHLENVKFSPALPKAFSERGLYMLSTILKSPQATQTTIAIVEAFAKLRELTRTVAKMTEATEDVQKKTLMQQGGEIMTELLGDDLKTTDTETFLELNFALFKVKHTVRRKNEN